MARPEQRRWDAGRVWRRQRKPRRHPRHRRRRHPGLSAVGVGTRKTFNDRGRPWRAAPARRAITILAATTLAAGCSRPSPPPPAQDAAAVVGRPRSSIIPDPAPVHPPTESPGTPTGTPTGSPEELARATLDTYLDALERQDFGRALAASAEAGRRLALVRFIVAEHNRDRGASTTVRLSARRFTPVETTARAVRFRGSVRFSSTVRARDGTVEETVREISDPRVERRGGRWLLTSMRWEGRPIVVYDGHGKASRQTVEFRLEGSIAFGDVVGVVVVLVADGEHHVRVENDRLRIDDEEAASGFSALIGGQPGLLYLTYPRRDPRPQLWRARVSIDGARSDVALSFV